MAASPVVCCGVSYPLPPYATAMPHSVAVTSHTSPSVHFPSSTSSPPCSLAMEAWHTLVNTVVSSPSLQLSPSLLPGTSPSLSLSLSPPLYTSLLTSFFFFLELCLTFSLFLSPSPTFFFVSVLFSVYIFAHTLVYALYSLENLLILCLCFTHLFSA